MSAMTIQKILVRIPVLLNKKDFGHIMASRTSTGAIVKNLASNVNLSYYMDLWTLGSKLQKNNCWTFFQ